MGLINIFYRFQFMAGSALCLITLGCGGEKVPDCFQSGGDEVREVLSVPAFDKITVYENVHLVLREGETQEVVVETGEYLKPEVTALVREGTLELRNTNQCNFFRPYGLTTFYVTSPEITVLRSSTGLPIESDGILGYNNLSLYSESFLDPNAETTDGSFDLQLDTDRLNVVSNGIAFFRLKGQAGRVNLTIAAGDSRIEAGELIADTIMVNHRGSNDMVVNPQNLLRGLIRGTGDVVSLLRPDSVDVEILYRGRLIFRD